MDDDDTTGADDKKPPVPPDPNADKGTDHAAEAEKWKALSRKHESDARKNSEAAKRLKELEDADKSETEKLTAKATEAERRAEAAEQRALRLEVAADKGLTAKQAARLVGTSREELESDADELVADFGGGKATDGNDGKGNDGKGPATRPKEQLRGGNDPTVETEETDPRKIAEKVARQ